MGIRDKKWCRRSGAGFFIPWERIKPGPWGNVRTEFPDETVAQRANSIILKGQENKIKGFLSEDEENFLLTDGELRWRAWKYAKDAMGVDLDSVLGGMYCEVDKKIGGKTPDTKEIKYRQLGYGTDTVPLSKLDQAKTIKWLVDNGEKVSSVAKNLGKTPQHVRDMLCLASAPDEIQDAVQKNQMAPTTAVKTNRAKKDTQKKVVDKILSGQSVKGREVDSEEHGSNDRNYNEPQAAEEKNDVASVPSGIMSEDEVRRQIKEVDGMFCRAKRDSERRIYQFGIHCLRVVLREADRF